MLPFDLTRFDRDVFFATSSRKGQISDEIDSKADFWRSFKRLARKSISLCVVTSNVSLAQRRLLQLHAVLWHVPGVKIASKPLQAALQLELKLAWIGKRLCDPPPFVTRQ